MTEYQPLTAARTYVRVLCRMADDAGDWKEHRLLESLHDVLDMVCHIVDHPDNPDHQAERAGPLVTAALDVRRAALQNVAGPAEDQHDDLSKAHTLEKNLDTEMNRVMRAIARRHDGTQLWCSDIVNLLGALRHLVEWVEKISATAVPDPVGE